MNINYTKQSISHLKHIYNYIAFDNQIAAKNLINKIQNSIALLKRNPYLGKVGRKEATRELYIPYTKYFIVYNVYLEKDIINIVAILHTSLKY